MTAPIRVAIVDDERLARERLRQLIEAEPDLEVVLTCADGDSAVNGIISERPDLVFLDVQMPVCDGFAVVARLLERMDPEELPLVVFVTAYEEHALRAFEAPAVDYLVKPFDDERFSAALQRVRRRVRQERLEAATGQLHAVLAAAADLLPAGSGSDTSTATPASESGRLERIVLKVGTRTRIIPAESVDWVAADGVYARLHLGRDSHLIRIPMHELERRLDPRRFVRIHRSTIVNLDRVRELEELFRGEYVVVLEDGTQLKLSRSRKAHLEKLLGQSL